MSAMDANLVKSVKTLKMDEKDQREKETKIFLNDELEKGTFYLFFLNKNALF